MDTQAIEVGACYRDPDDGEIVRVLGPADGPGWRTRTLVAGRSGLDAGVEFSGRILYILYGWARVPDPTPAVREDACLAKAEQLTGGAS